MEAAVRIFYEKGYSGASLQDVANEVGVLKGSLYYYFDSKEDLLLRIMKESHIQSELIFDRVSAKGLDPLDELDELLQELMQWYLDNVERVAIYFNEGRRLTGERLEEVEAAGRRFEQHLYNLLKRAQKGGAIQDVDLRLSIRFILGALNSVPTWHKPSSQRRLSDKAITRQFAQMTIKSMSP
ncbi:HTH-type transcriptional repressor KstR2 [Rhodococcus sp. T7]|jgi:AcrR family transcriptional regulator|nr:HTH-type transcriptional repressor KstR2 [Rhodococcus sp. T7]